MSVRPPRCFLPTLLLALFASLQLAAAPALSVQDAVNGTLQSTLKLAHSFVVPAPLVIDHTMTLEGGSGVALSLKSAGNDAAQAKGDVIDVTGGDVTIQDLNITGGRGSGLRVTGSARVKLVRCSFNQNAGGGAVFLDNCVVDASECIAMQNLDFGYLAAGAARVTLNKCGAVLQSKGAGQAEPHGIDVLDRARATLVDCVCMQNSVGVAVCNRARLDATGLSCKDQTNSGLVVIGDGRARVRNSQFKRNQHDGVSVMGEAQADLDGCTAEQNAGQGVVFAAKARGGVKGCKFVKNSIGLNLSTDREVALSDDEFSMNAKTGLVCAGDGPCASPVATLPTTNSACWSTASDGSTCATASTRSTRWARSSTDAPRAGSTAASSPTTAAA